MEFELIPLKRYRKGRARKENNFKSFDPFNDSIAVNTNYFNINSNSSVYIAKSRKEFKAAQKKMVAFIYQQNKGLLYYNENGDGRKFGKGGVIAIFYRHLRLESNLFKFISRSITPKPDQLPKPAQILAPTDLLISASSFDENISAGSVVASFQTNDQDVGDTHIYSMISGDYSEDNGSFEIIGNQLKIKESPDFETQDSYSIRLQTKDSNGLTFEKSFTVTVNDLNEYPTDLLVSVSSFYENINAGSVVASLETIDQDSGDTYSYSLGSGDDSEDNGSFEVADNQLKIKESPDFEDQSSYSIRLQAKDSGGLTFEKSFTLHVIDLDEITPTADAIFPQGPSPTKISFDNFSGAIDSDGEVDRFPISSFAGVVSLSVEAADGTWPLVRLVDQKGRELDPVSAYNNDSASTAGYRNNGDLLFAEVFAQNSYTGSYDLQVARYESNAPMRSIPQDLLILLDQNAMDSADEYASSYLFSDDGLIYVSFGSGLTDELKIWWEDVLAATDALIEPEFVVVPQSHPKSQIVLNQISAFSLGSDTSGIYKSPIYTYSELSDGGKYHYRRNDNQGTITLSDVAYTHASRFADSREAGWKSTAFHELGHALGLEHPHDSSDGDVNSVIDTNGTVMSYEKAQDSNGDPGFTDLDVRALQFVYGSESGAKTPSPLAGVPLLIESREFDLSRRWMAPKLSAQWIDGNSVQEPSSGLFTKRLQLTRMDGDLAIESTIWLDFDTGPGVMNWGSRTGYSEDFHDVLILGNSITFQPGEAKALFELPIVAGSHAESDEWLDVTVRPKYPHHYSAVPDSALRLTIIDA